MAKKKEEQRVVNSFEENKELREKIYDDIFGDSDLTDKQKDFVMLYLSNSNPTISYFSAFNVKNKKTAGVLGNMEIKKPKIQSALKRAKKLMAYTLDIDPLEYVEYNLKIAKADIGDYMSFYTEEVPETDVDGSPVLDENGNQKFKKISRLKFKNSDECDTSLLSEVSQGRDGIKLSLPNKYKAWENLKNYFDWGTKKDSEADSNSLIDAISKSTKKLYENQKEENNDSNDDWKEATKDY